MWVGMDAGHDHFYDELFEIQELNDFKWQFLNFTGRRGDVIPEGLDLEPPPGRSCFYSAGVVGEMIPSIFFLLLQAIKSSPSQLIYAQTLRFLLLILTL